MDDNTIRGAVDTLCSNEAAAIAMFGPVSTWNTSAVTSMKGLFSPDYDLEGEASLNSRTYMATCNPDISQWDTSRVTTMYAMFYGASSFNGLYGSPP